jgi:hypothetical protein
VPRCVDVVLRLASDARHRGTGPDVDGSRSPREEVVRRELPNIRGSEPRRDGGRPKLLTRKVVEMVTRLPEVNPFRSVTSQPDGMKEQAVEAPFDNTTCIPSVRRDDALSPSVPMVRPRRVTNASAVLPGQSVNRTRPAPEPVGPAEFCRLRQPQPPFGVQRPETATAGVSEGEQRRGPVIRPAESLRRGQGGPQLVLGQIMTAEE